MVWLRVGGCLKIQVSFAKEPYKRDQYSAKETHIFKNPTHRSYPIASIYERDRYIYICAYIQIYICVEKERERERERQIYIDICKCATKLRVPSTHHCTTHTLQHIHCNIYTATRTLQLVHCNTYTGKNSQTSALLIVCDVKRLQSRLLRMSNSSLNNW